jgi:hypothetical protein
MPYGELPPLTDDEFRRMSDGTLTPEDFPEAERREKTQAYLERMYRERPEEWQAWFNYNAQEWLKLMKRDNGRVTPYNPTGRRFKRRQLKLMANQRGFDAMGVNFAAHANTADELLSRAEAMTAVGASLSSGPLM